MNGDGALEISFAKGIVLENENGSGVGVGLETVGIVAHHAAQAGDDIRRKSVLVGNDSHGFNVLGILQLAWRARNLSGREAPGLLHLLVRKLVAGELVTDDQTQAVFRS